MSSENVSEVQLNEINLTQAEKKQVIEEVVEEIVE